MNFATAPFLPVQELFQSMLDADPHYSAQLAVYRDGEPVLALSGGPLARPDTLTGVYSCSKGVAALAFALLVQDGLIELDAAVAAYWPDFARHGKQALTVRQLLSHQGGLVGVQGGFAMTDYNDLALVADRLADTAPQWRPGNGTFGYHALTMGVFLEQLCLLVTGERLQALYDRRIRGPYAADMFLGLPAEQDGRYRDVIFGQGPAQDFEDPGSLNALAGNAAAGTLLHMPNVASIRAAGSTSAAGVGSADGLARVYAGATTGVGGLAPYLSADTVAQMSMEQVWGVDRIIAETAAFAVTFMKPSPRMDFGSAAAFGHEGANGALGFADPLYGIGFGYVPAAVEPGTTPGRGMQLSRAVRRALAAGA